MLDLRSHRTQLVITAISASLLTASLFSAYTHWTRGKRRKALARDVHRSLARHPSSSHVGPHPDEKKWFEEERADDIIITGYDEDLIREQLARNYAFFGEESMAKIRKRLVVIVGCGGVGSWAAVMLVRS
jgi:hypothetical protein